MTTTMHFGPEWMRNKHQTPARPQPQPSPPPLSAPSSASTYSALVSPAPPPQPEKRDEAHPFRYSKEEMLRIYKEGGGKGGLGLEVERWEGVVREVASEPIGLRDMGDAEKKLFAGPLNSDLRRRQSSDYLSPLSTQNLGTERPRLSHSNSASGSPLRERFSGLKRRDSTDQPPTATPRKLSLTSAQVPLNSSRDTSQPSPRTRGFTPSFDGVLNSGESWVSRRRASEGLNKPGGGVLSRGEGGAESQQDTKATEIREEEEEDHIDARQDKIATNKSDSRKQSLSPQPEYPPGNGSKDSMPPESQTLNKDFVDVSPNLDVPHVLGSSDPVGVGPPPGIQDLSSVEWSYLDPQGHVQGPFRADLMQKWYDDGYFAQDLLMRRTHIDTDWLAVAELARRSGSEKIFLTLPIQSVAPPGLTRRAESPTHGFPTGEHIHFNAPYQPAPVRSLRTSTLDSYLSTGSNPSDSPSSSYGAGRFGNGSPDPAAFGGRAGNHGYTGSDRLTSYAAAPEPVSTISGVRRNTFQEPSLDPSQTLLSPSFPNLAHGRGSAVDAYGFNGAYSPSINTGWNSSSSSTLNTTGFNGLNSGGRTPVDVSNSFNPNLGPGSNMGPSAFSQTTSYGNVRNSQGLVFGDGVPGPFPGSEYNSVGEMGNQRETKLPNRVGPDDKVSGSFLDYNGLNGAPFVSSGPSQQFAHYPTPQQQSLSSHSHVFGQPGLTASSVPSTVHSVNQNSHLHTSSPTQSPWNTPDPGTSRRLGPFEAPHPTVNNTIPITPQPSFWGHPNHGSQRNSLVTNQPSRFPPPQDAVDENRKEAPGPNSLTFSNVGQHNQQQQQIDSPIISTANVLGNLEDINPPPLTPPPPEPALPAAPSVATAKPSGKSATRSNQNHIPSANPPLQIQNVKSPSPPPASKPAWTSEEEAKKSKPSGVSLSLREIQEAETKKAEARKTVERERERERASRVQAATEEAQSFTTSWGLPTSQAGTRNSNSSKDNLAGTSSSPATSAQVWTTTPKPPTTKQSMKEIQEEEEKRKKLAAKETTAAAAARRAYVEGTNKAAPVVQGPAWTTVGPSGKSSPLVVTPTRPSLTPSSSTLSTSASTPRVNGSAVPRPATAFKAVSAPKVDEHPAPSSHDFLKWLSDSLKGLNSSVNVEEIVSMLLSFPVDPDTSTTEIISDLIYANSTTLDGRRFAAEFVSRRKADATSRPKGANGSGSAQGKPISIADVVKAQPKPTQPEWGGFKVVNKKKKGGRA